MRSKRKPVRKFGPEYGDVMTTRRAMFLMARDGVIAQANRQVRRFEFHTYNGYTHRFDRAPRQILHWLATGVARGWAKPDRTKINRAIGAFRKHHGYK